MENKDTAPPPGGQYIVQLMRTTQQHHVQLSFMADQKANILIGAALILLTFLSSQLQPGHINLPYLALSITTTISGVFALLVLIPRVAKISSDSKSFNILFFGHFSLLSESAFQSRVEATIADEYKTYKTMTKDIYQMGKVLQRKYRFLRWSYQVFLAGWLLAFLLYLYSALV